MNKKGAADRGPVDVLRFWLFHATAKETRTAAVGSESVKKYSKKGLHLINIRSKVLNDNLLKY